MCDKQRIYGLNMVIINSFFFLFFPLKIWRIFWGFLANLGYVSLVLGPIFLRQTWIPPTHHLPPSKEKIHVDVMRLHLH